MMFGYDYSWFSMSLMMIGMTLWIALLVVLVWALIRWLNRKTLTSMPKSDAPVSELSALEILHQRYARGEIDAGTYEQMKERLEGSSASRYQYESQMTGRSL